MRTLRGRARLGIVTLIIAAVTTVVVATVVASLYRTIFEDKLDDLQDLAAAEARFVATIAELESSLNAGDPEGAINAALSRVRDELQASEGFGETGEISVGRYAGDVIEFVGSNRADGPIAPAPPSSPNGEPMSSLVAHSCSTRFLRGLVSTAW